MKAGAESARLAALARYGVLDTPREAVFDRITEMASIIYAAPMAAIALVDAERVWFKSRVGVDVAVFNQFFQAKIQSFDFGFKKPPVAVNDDAARLQIQCRKILAQMLE